jgi:hypothetical protein
MLNVVASLCATGLVAAFVWRRRQAWFSCQFDHDDRLVVLFVLVLGANAVISYPYTKDVIMSPAGAFYALAFYAAMKAWWASNAASPRPVRGTAFVLCVLLAATWSMRAIGIHATLRYRAQVVRNEWAYVDDWVTSQHFDGAEPRAARLRRQLQQDALIGRPAPPAVTLPFAQLLDIY